MFHRKLLAFLLLVFFVISLTAPAASGIAGKKTVTPTEDTIRVYRTATGQIEVLDIETEYLPYVVAAENGEAPFESMKAQAVVSRTFAYYKKNHPSGSNFDLYDDERDQVYNPNKVLNKNHKKAVSETNGFILKYDGDTICSFYVKGTGNTAKYVTYNEGKSGDSIYQTSLGWRTDPPSKNPYNRGCMGQVQANKLANKGYDWISIFKYFYGEDIILTKIDLTKSNYKSQSKNTKLPNKASEDEVVSLSVLRKAAANDPARPQGEITPDADDDVKIVEEALAKEGLLSSKYAYDGSYGTATIKAYKKWQESIGSAPRYCDGIPGKKDLTKLGKKYGFTVDTSN
ncbi:SpoIID/LytB domain protein [Methanosarcina thermophila]|jgi:hypothetical protein|uniref:SpoIID/LytB domain protein n=3 Tax=Methanosarcina thermophila TaxID=2210 RepID=A0A1I7B8U0_METTE|nr:SpoIID/LytB domain-containing protein [Methanosarcina thermophila]AKB13106.1 Phage protein [Methanosarcina thermophila TM-1]AKB16262.1 Phage protein [Methanosarcina thermophila CHTI-55]NLU58184.1 hypothetical protein [Methanosarcina thermophila]SFT83620.1 SpoIID/LytB domain protein [Methanosarcina thermophila]BAW28096.1 SpoIID/LytB domain protein [Methanosarcina thermophila]